MNKKSEGRKIFWITAIALALTVLTFLMSRSKVEAIGGSTITGFAVMQHMSHESVPYNIALENGKPTLLEFYANWCTTCQLIAPSLSELHQKYGDSVNFVMLDIDDPQWNPIIDQYRVTGVPQLTFLDANQQTVRTEIGRVPPSILDQIFQQIST